MEEGAPARDFPIGEIKMESERAASLRLRIWKLVSRARHLGKLEWKQDAHDPGPGLGTLGQEMTMIFHCVMQNSAEGSLRRRQNGTSGGLNCDNLAE